MSDFVYFLEWFANHWFLGLVTLIIICVTLASCCGAIASIWREKDSDSL